MCYKKANSFNEKKYIHHKWDFLSSLLDQFIIGCIPTKKKWSHIISHIWWSQITQAYVLWIRYNQTYDIFEKIRDNMVLEHMLLDNFYLQSPWWTKNFRLYSSWRRKFYPILPDSVFKCIKLRVQKHAIRSVWGNLLLLNHYNNLYFNVHMLL